MTTTTTDRMHVLQISWSVSRGRDTYGYNICRLDDTNTGKRYRCSGGGYDMTGTVLGDWLEDTHQDALRAIADRAYYVSTSVGLTTHQDGLYGMYSYPGKGTVSIDGGCGVSSVERIGQELGLRFRHVVNRAGRLTGIIVYSA